MTKLGAKPLGSPSRLLSGWVGRIADTESSAVNDRFGLPLADSGRSRYGHPGQIPTFGFAPAVLSITAR